MKFSPLYRPALSSTFIMTTLTAYGSTYALGVHYERSPDALRVQKPIFYPDNCFARWTDMYVPVLFLGSFVNSCTADYLRNSLLLPVFFLPISRYVGTAFALGTYFGAGAVSTLTWRLQSNLNPEKNHTRHDRNTAASGAIAGLAGAALLIPKASPFKSMYVPLGPLAALFLGERLYNEYGRERLFGKPEAKHPLQRQWGCLGGAVFGAICCYTSLRKRTGHVMKKTFTQNFGPKWV